MSLHYLAKLLLRSHLTFSKLLMVFVGVSKFVKTNILSILKLRLMAHTTVTCC